MLASFPDSFLCPRWQRVMEWEQDWRRLPVPVVRWRLHASLYPSKDNCPQQQVMSLIHNRLFHFCIVCTTCITLGLTCACNHACKQGEWGERVLSMWVTLGFWMIQSKLGCVTQNAKCIFNFYILCLVYTVQPLDNFITYVNTQLWALWEEGLWKGGCATQVLHTTRSRSPHNALHSPSIYICHEKSQLNTLVWGSLTLAPISWPLVS